MPGREILKTGYGDAFDREYDQLPEGLKVSISPKEYAWTDPAQRALLVEQECYPDATED